MSSKSTTKANGAKVAASKQPKNGTGKSSDKTSTHYELLPQEEVSGNDSQEPTAKMEGSNVTEGTETTTKKVEVVAAKSKPKKVEAVTPKSKPQKVAQKKTVIVSKSVAVNTKKIRLAASTYHYYRNWLAEFMRSHGVPSAKFQKSPESYNGHIIVLETEKAKGIKALEQWSKQNPDTKELFWDVKK